MKGLRTVNLDTLEATQGLAGVFARLATEQNLGLILFYGDLGAGKTTLIRYLAAELPGGEQAEVSSPSFTLCNEYATDPPILHFDLYRCAEGQVDEGFSEALERLAAGERLLVLVEWAERICPCEQKYFPPDYLACHLTGSGNKRTAKLAQHGCKADITLKALHALGYLGEE